MIRRPPRSTRTDTLFPTRRSSDLGRHTREEAHTTPPRFFAGHRVDPEFDPAAAARSEEHTSELQSLMRISYAVFCSKQKINHIVSTIVATLQTRNSKLLKSIQQSA